MTSSTPPGSAISSVVVAESKREKRPMETARLRYPEKVKGVDLEGLECRRELAETLGIERVSHEDLNKHHCVDWLKAHEAHFSRTKLRETADFTGIPTKAIMGPINYRPLNLLGSPGLIAEPPKHRTSIARIRLATPAQLKVVDKLLNPEGMELPDAAYEGSKFAEDPRYGKPCGSTQLAKTLAVYDRADPAAARVVIVAGSDFEGTSPKLFWPETLIYSLPGAELNQMLTLVVELWDTVVKYGEPLLIGTGLDERARKELLNKLIELRNSRSKTREEKCEDGSTLKQKTVDKIVDDIKGDKVGTSNMIKSTNILKARAGGRQELEGLEVDREVESVMIATTPSSRDVKTRKRKREVEGLGSPSVDGFGSMQDGGMQDGGIPSK